MCKPINVYVPRTSGCVVKEKKRVVVVVVVDLVLRRVHISGTDIKRESRGEGFVNVYVPRTSRCVVKEQTKERES